MGPSFLLGKCLLEKLGFAPLKRATSSYFPIAALLSTHHSAHMWVFCLVSVDGPTVGSYLPQGHFQH